jgi:hypothetical protein
MQMPFGAGAVAVAGGGAGEAPPTMNVAVVAKSVQLKMKSTMAFTVVPVRTESVNSVQCAVPVESVTAGPQLDVSPFPAS